MDNRQIFHRIFVDHFVIGTTRVWWTISPQFQDPGPWTFTLQVGETGDPAADDWAQVGLPAQNACFLADDTQRLFGTNPVTHYRVVLQTPVGTYTSNPAPVWGILPPHDWNIAREIVRKERLRLTGFVAVEGQLLKRRRTGTTPTASQAPADPTNAVIDPLTGDIIRRDSTTWGTPFNGGYYKPVPFSFDMDPSGLYEQVEPTTRGNIDTDGMIVSGRAVLIPSIAHFDLFIADNSDLRYVIHRVKFAAQYRGVPLVGYPVELRQLPFSDLLYQLDPTTL